MISVRPFVSSERVYDLEGILNCFPSSIVVSHFSIVEAPLGEGSGKCGME